MEHFQFICAALVYVTMQDILHSEYHKSPFAIRFHHLLNTVMGILKQNMTASSDSEEQVHL